MEARLGRVLTDRARARTVFLWKKSFPGTDAYNRLCMLHVMGLLACVRLHPASPYSHCGPTPRGTGQLESSTHRGAERQGSYGQCPVSISEPQSAHGQ